MATGAQTSPLAIVHIEGSDPPAFLLTHSDHKSLPPVAIPSPYEFPVEGSPQFRLMRDLRWYLEKFLDHPYHPDTIHADHVLDALKAWGSQAFNAIFDRGFARKWLSQSNIIQIRSDDPAVLSWPWEALFDSAAGSYVVLQNRMERQLNKLLDPSPTGDLPNDRINVLLVVARPYENDVNYRSIARPLVDLIRTQNLPAHVDVLRPPTFDQLRAHLENHPGLYHLLHFDGHGSYGIPSSQGSSHQFRAREGHLIFEDETGEPDPKSAADLSALLREYAVPAVVLNACQSAALDDKAEDPFATVATALLQSGMRSVVAMAYSLYVSGAQSFLPAFYERLFKTGSIAEGVRAGRRQMLSDKRRTSPRGPYELEDWLLPVLYQQQPIDFTFAAEAKLEARESRLPPEVLNHRDEYDFIGRDGPILEMERALHLKTPCILLQGLGGVGKTTLARGFLRWLDETGGLDAALWFDFRDIRSAEYVLNRTGQPFYGENFSIAPNKVELIADKLKQHRFIIVWDNFESATQNLPNEDRAALGQLLDAIRGTRGKVIITSRSTEEWLTPPRRYRLSLGGLHREERWEYCESVLTGLGLKVDRNDSKLLTLMDLLMGHPLAMRVVLPRLEWMSTLRIIEALRTNIAALELSLEQGESRVFATLRFVERGLPQEFRPAMGLIGLHEAYLDADCLEVMATQSDPGLTRSLIDRLMEALGSAGLSRSMKDAVHELHPLLTSYMRSQYMAGELQQRAFVDVMARVADQLTPLELHKQIIPFLHHGANLYCALQISETLAMDHDFTKLAQSIAAFALNSGNFVEASQLFQQQSERAAGLNHWEMEAAAYHQLGRVAQEQHNFDLARRWYLKSLSISEKQNSPVAHQTLSQLGIVAERQRDFESARDFYTRALALAEKEHEQLLVAKLFHQLGSIAQELWDFETARDWYIKSLAISRTEDLSMVAKTYHQLGMISEVKQDWETAEQWHLKSLAIVEKRGNQPGAAISYHHLGLVSQGLRDFESAREFYLKSLNIKEKRGDMYGAAISYHQLGRVAELQRDLETAQEWYLKSLDIEEMLNDRHGAASTLGQLGILAGYDDRFTVCAEYLTRSISAFRQTSDFERAERNTTNFLIFYERASPEDQQKMESVWHEAALGPFPTQDES